MLKIVLLLFFVQNTKIPLVKLNRTFTQNLHQLFNTVQCIATTKLVLQFKTVFELYCTNEGYLVKQTKTKNSSQLL